MTIHEQAERAHTALTCRFAGVTVEPRPAGTLWVPSLRLLAVADLHLGKAERMARRGGALLPPFETLETLARLQAEVHALDPGIVVCVGDSLDDSAAALGFDAETRASLTGMIAGRRWIWISGNHDPTPTALGGENVAEWRTGGLVFRHIAKPGATGEISGHYHPKAVVCLRGRRLRRDCFLADAHRIILPAFGTYTGGLDATAPVFDDLLGQDAAAWLLANRVTPVARAALVPR